MWLDADGDGTQTPGELGAADVTIDLIDATGSVIATTSSEADGSYDFAVSPGAYSVKFHVPAGCRLTEFRQGGGSMDSMGWDSEADPATGMTEQVEVAKREVIRSLDAGLICGDGEPGDPDVPPVVVPPIVVPPIDTDPDPDLPDMPWCPQPCTNGMCLHDQMVMQVHPEGSPYFTDPDWLSCSPINMLTPGGPADGKVGGAQPYEEAPAPHATPSPHAMPTPYSTPHSTPAPSATPPIHE